MKDGMMNRPLIFAVDNAPMFLSTLKRILEGEPYNIHCETTAEEAFEFLKTTRPDLILLDVEMPDMDGYEMAQKIKNSGQTAPIVFITAHSEKEYADKAAEAGASGVLIKPLRRTQLLEKIKELVR